MNREPNRESGPTGDERRTPWQFDLQTIFLATLCTAATLGYARLWPEGKTLLLLAGVAASPVFGVVIGWPAGRTSESIFWALFGALGVAICGMSSRMSIPYYLLFWVLGGGVLGALSGAFGPGRLLWRVAASAIAGVLWTLGFTWLLLPQASVPIEAACFAGAGITAALGVEVAAKFEQTGWVKRQHTMTLVLAVAIAISAFGRFAGPRTW